MSFDGDQAVCANHIPRGIRAICFDAGDTLIFDHPSRYERAATACAACGIRCSAKRFGRALRRVDAYAVGQYLQGRATDDFGLIADCIAMLLGEIGQTTQRSAVAKVARAYAAIAFARRLDAGVVDLLKILRTRGFKIGVISDWEPDLMSLFDSLGCEGMIDAFSISGVVGATKPSAALFGNALNRLGVAGCESVHVGDFLELDVEGARSAGMHAILFDSKGLYTGAAVPPDVPVVSTFADLVNLLLSLPVP